MKLVALAVLAIIFQHREARTCSLAPPCDELVALASPDPAKLDSADGETTAKAALALAKSGKPEHLKALGAALQKPAVLARIMKDQGQRCLMPPVLRALATNPAAEARAQFVALVSSPAWAERPDASDGFALLQALLQATGALRPPATEIIAFWKKYSTPQGGWVNVTVMAMTENGSVEAAAAFEALLRDPAHEVDSRISFLHLSLLANRDKLELLRTARRLLDSKLEPAVKTAIAEAVFDYRQRWFGMCPGPARITGAMYRADARRELRAIAAKARTQKPDKELAAAITTTLGELDKADAAKQP